MGRFLLRSLAAIAMLSLLAFGIAALAAAMPVALTVFAVVAVALTLTMLIALPFMFMRSNAPTAVVARPTVIHAHPTVVPGPTVVVNRPYFTPVYSSPAYVSPIFGGPRYVAPRGPQNIVVAAPTPVFGGRPAMNHGGGKVHGHAAATNRPVMNTPSHAANGMFAASRPTVAPSTDRGHAAQRTAHHGHR